jgi:hypothetical protein
MLLAALTPATAAIAKNTMQQVLFCARTSRVPGAMKHAAKRSIAWRRRVADSESRILATKLFSSLTAEALVRAYSSRRFARIADRDSHARRDLNETKFALGDACARLISTSREETASTSPSRSNA